jgi:predicted RNase H-like HicB family nuclease
MEIRYSMIIQWSDEDQLYIATIPEFDDCKTHGATYEEAAHQGRELLELLVESYNDRGELLPRPLTFNAERELAVA